MADCPFIDERCSECMSLDPANPEEHERIKKIVRDVGDEHYNAMLRYDIIDADMFNDFQADCRKCYEGRRASGVAHLK